MRTPPPSARRSRPAAPASPTPRRSRSTPARWWRASTPLALRCSSTPGGSDLHDPPEPFVTTLAPHRDLRRVPRVRRARAQEHPGAGVLPAVLHRRLPLPAPDKQWGYLLRPSDFDEQAIKRYGTEGAVPQPVPVPGENPNLTDGGSGQLPRGLVQAKDANGRWNGLIGSTCSACHDSRLGTGAEAPFVRGRSSDANDAGLLQSDFFRANTLPSCSCWRRSRASAAARRMRSASSTRCRRCGTWTRCRWCRGLLE